MRITIDTEMHVIIVPDSYYAYVDKLNDIIVDAGGNALDYKAFIRNCFEKAYRSELLSQSEFARKNEGKRRKSRTKNGSAEHNEGKVTEV